MLRPRSFLIRSSKVIGRANQSTDSLADIKQIVPQAVKRSPTDLLSALSSTVGTDPTAPHFQFIDDPAMIPSTVANKRNYYMAKEMGKRAARQLATEWPTLFAFDRDQPRLEVFRPKGRPDPLQMEVSEESVLRLVEERAVKDACILYEKMRADGGDISEGAKDRLFALTAFYNSEDVPLSEEEEWGGLRNMASEERTKWISAGVADLLYESLPSTPQRKAMMIVALCKYPSQEGLKRAEGLYQELLKESPSTIPTAVFAEMIKKGGVEEGMAILSKMNTLGVRPDGRVWGAMMEGARRVKGYEKRGEKMRRVMEEMRACGERGGLSIFDTLLNGLKDWEEGVDEKERERRMGIAVAAVQEIMADLEGRETIKIESTTDCHFFCTAMVILRDSGNLALGRRLLSIYEGKSNEVKLRIFSNEGVFYSSYLQLCVSQVQSVEELYKIYISHVPRVIGVTKNLVANVLRRLGATPHWPLLARVIDDSVSSRLMVDQRTSVDIRMALLNTQLQSLSPSERDEFSLLIPRLVSIWTEFSRFTAPNQKRLQMKWHPASLADCALLLTRIGERERAWGLLEMMCEEENMRGDDATILEQGRVKMVTMNELLDDAIRRGHGENAATCIQLMGTTEVNKQRLGQMANTVIQRCNLSPTQARILSGFVRLRQD